MIAIEASVGFGGSASAQDTHEFDPRSLLVDVGDADLESLAADEKFDKNHPVFLRVARRLAQLDQALLVRSAKTERPSDTTQPGQLLNVSGQVSKLESFEVPGDADSDQAAMRFYLLDVVSESGETAQVVSLEIPRVWNEELPDANRRVSSPGYFLKWIILDGKRVSLFAAPRIAWFPDSASAVVSPGWVLLGRAGVDVGAIDAIASRAGRELDHAEMLSFLQWVVLAPTAVPAGHAGSPLQIVDLLQSSRGQEGSCFDVTGNVQRISELDLSDQPNARWLGLKKYYQIDLFVSMGDRTLNMVDPAGGPPLVIENEYPVTLIASDVSPEIRHAQQNGSPIVATAFFYRLWSFPTVLSRQTNPNRNQVAPLFIVSHMRMVPMDRNEFSRGITWFVVVGVALFAVFILWMWRMGRTERVVKRK